MLRCLGVWVLGLEVGFGLEVGVIVLGWLG